MSGLQFLVLIGVILYGTAKPDTQKGDLGQCRWGMLLLLAALVWVTLRWVGV